MLGYQWPLSKELLRLEEGHASIARHSCSYDKICLLEIFRATIEFDLVGCREHIAIGSMDLLTGLSSLGLCSESRCSDLHSAWMRLCLAPRCHQTIPGHRTEKTRRWNRCGPRAAARYSNYQPNMHCLLTGKYAHVCLLLPSL